MYDLIIVGAGPAGYEAALYASKLGKQVLVIEKNKIGGTCLNYGCIPTKSLLFQTNKIKEINNSKAYGISVDNYTYKYETILQNKDKTVNRLVKGIEFLFKKNNVNIVFGVASLVNQNQIKVNDEIFESKNILICVGSTVTKLNIPGFENSISSKEFLDLDLSKFKNVVIVGGGVIGVEIATILNNLGIKVVILEAKDQLIPTFENEVATRLKKQLNRLGIKVYLNSFVNKIEKNCVYTSDDSYPCDFVLTSVGRSPNTNGLDPQNLLIKDRGFIEINEKFQTNLENIYAVGDCVKGIQLAHYASACAINVVKYLFENDKRFNINNVPKCIYTEEEISVVGKEQSEGDIVLKTDLIANPKAVVEDHNKGFIKLIFTKEGLFKGAVLMCKKSSDMINIFVNALNRGATIDDFKHDIYPHPSYSESILALFD